ncbi:non-specific lipid-transfer protein C6 [Brachypodium distachyon]|uniref:Bifunctional inhibitor/plant lipid transfer protein/seed storage helical domain-containing protein n=1 Tax=Brachypodium distachyon TaxID=15368 RepID=I1IKW7_BRADI|nr:non-specific lipid-transfer protein C6 [Brachypodium distachyon]KQJ88108.1 hypothetical protein BRADI_4g15420v3 [Brachypodium distachyon]|eukprot:XP_024310944.1 non-specific lipid-transfer protein C6 [Brachypodium distachyon]
MASPKSPALLLLLLASVLALASGQQQQEYCRDTLGGLEACHAFMYEGAARASAGCCAAYSAAFDADPFCLCYIANGVYGRSTGYNVNVTHALEIPTSCGQIAPPIDLCNMQGLVLPPYGPANSPAAPGPAQAPLASSPAAQPPSASAGSVETPPSTLLSSAPPPPQPTSGGARDSSVKMAFVFFAVACIVAAVA